MIETEEKGSVDKLLKFIEENKGLIKPYALFSEVGIPINRAQNIFKNGNIRLCEEKKINDQIERYKNIDLTNFSFKDYKGIYIVEVQRRIESNLKIKLDIRALKKMNISEKIKKEVSQILTLK